uniref:ATP-dependent helicase C-terminal domain-containing protein n=1 Tax=Algoriphagus sp. TaxID=1872435 RepID=UPI0025E1BD7F
DLAPMLKSKEVLEWDRKKGGLIAHTEVRIGAIILGKRPLAKFDPSLAKKAILEAVKEEGELLLDWNDDVLQLINRVQSLHLWNPDQNWQNWTISYLCETAEFWLEPYLNNIKHNDDFKKLDLFEILNSSLDYDMQQELSRLAPPTFSVPSGSKIKIEYRDNGDTPLLSVRLQELFGLLETPTVNDGKISLLIEMLSPGYKAVQLTQDLKSFWSNGYFEVKKELKRRYPKHEWPEDPIAAEAVRGVKKKP